MMPRTPYADLPCPNCQQRNSHVTDSRGVKGGYIWRRRECLSCHQRYTTRELPVDQAASRSVVDQRLSQIEATIAKLRDDLSLQEQA